MNNDSDDAIPSPAPSEVQDLTQEENAIARPIAPIDESLGSTATLADWTRLTLAGGLLIILAILTLGTGWFVANYPDKEKAIEAYLQLVFTPLVGLVGSVVGFYFGSRISAGSVARTRRKS